MGKVMDLSLSSILGVDGPAAIPAYTACQFAGWHLIHMDKLASGI